MIWLFLAPFMTISALAGAIGYLPMRGWRWRTPTHFKSGGRIIFSYPYCFLTHWGLKENSWCPNCGYDKSELLK